VLERSPFIRLVLNVGSGRSNPWADGERDSYVEQWRERERAQAAVQVYRSFLTRELLPILRGRYRGARLRVPTLLLNGENDPVVRPERLGRWREHADAMTVEELRGAAHFLPEEVPEAVLERLVPFLR
jgi:pimeloyl-ACP methyl ester carboxylesterase